MILDSYVSLNYYYHSNKYDLTAIYLQFTCYEYAHVLIVCYGSMSLYHDYFEWKKGYRWENRKNWSYNLKLTKVKAI